MQEALRRRQAALEKRIAEGRGDGRMRRRLNWRERTAERARLAREQQEHRRRIIQVGLCRFSWLVCTYRLMPVTCAGKQ
jgi:hypothetical protein